MSKHAEPQPWPVLNRKTWAELGESRFANKDVQLTVWQGNYGNSTEHTWEELRTLHAQLGALLHEAEQLEVEYEYAVQLRDSDRNPWIDWDQDRQVWGTKGRIERYLASWVGKAECWRYMQYRVFKRPKAGSTQMVAEGTGHDTTPATF